MFNPYSFQGGTATLDPQICGTNGHARIPEAAAAFNPAMAATMTGIPVGQPSSVGYGYQSYIPSQIPFANYAPTSYGIPAGVPAFQPTPFGYAPTHFNPWFPVNMNPIAQSFNNPYATINPYAGFNPFINQTINPFTGCPTTFPMNTVNPYTGIPTMFPTNYAPSFNPMAQSFYGSIPTPFSPVPFASPFNAVRPGISMPTIGAWPTPFSTPFNMVSPFQQPGFVNPFFSNPVNFQGLTSPFAQVAASVNPLAGVPSAFSPLGVAPAANQLLLAQLLAAGVDPITCSVIANQSIVNPAFGLSPLGALPFTSNVNPWITSRLGLNTFGGINSLQNPILSNILNPYNAISPWNTLNNVCAPFGCTPTNLWNTVNSFGSTPMMSPFSNGLSGFNPLSFNGGFGSFGSIPGFSPVNTSACTPTCCI